MNLSLSDAMGTLGDSTVITNADGFAYTTYSPDGGSGSVFVNAAVENSTASLFFDVTYTTTGYDESYSYSHTEAMLVAELNTTGSTDHVNSGETRELSLSVRYETWDVMTNSFGFFRTENHTSAPAEGASVTWISESGDASVSGYSMVDAAGLCQGSLMMGSGDSVDRAEVSYAAGQATSASLHFAAAPYLDPSGGDPTTGDPGGDPTTGDPGGAPSDSDWSYSRSETIASISNLAAGGSTELSTGESRSITGEVRHEVWDVWVNGYGMEDWRYNYAGPAAWATVTAAIEFGDGSLGSTTVTSDGQGWFALDYTMGSSSSRVTVSADGATSASGTNGSASVDFTYSSTTGQPDYGNVYDNGGTSSPSLLSYDGSYRIEGPHSDGPTYDLTPGTQRTVSGVLYWDSWEVWSDGSGNTTIENPQSYPAAWSGLSLSLAQGDGTIADSSITTDSSGGFTTTFAMGNEASRVRIEATGGSSGTIAAELDFTPPPAGPVDDFVKVRDESSLFVTITGGSPQAGTETIPLEAQVTETTWEVWENGIAPAELRNYRTGPAIAASVEFTIASGSGNLTAIDSLTDADGTARATIIPGQADTVVAVNASFLTTGASGQITVSPVPWVRQSIESSLLLSLQQTDNTVTATVRLQSWEIWVNPATGLGESRHESEGPAVNAEVIFQSLATSGCDATFSPPTVMTATDGTASTIYTSLDATMAQVTAHFAGQSVTETIHLPTASGGNGTDNGGGTDYYGYTTNGPDGGGPDGGGPDGGGPDGGGPTVTPSPVPVNLRGRYHQTTGGSGTPSSEDGDDNPDEGKDTLVTGEGPDLGPYHELLALNYSHAEYHEVTLYERFKATLVRDLLANDGVTVTGEEEKEVEGLVVDKEEILAPELEDRWRVRDEEELDPYQGYRWEVSFGGSIDYNTTGSDANGEALEVNGRTSPSSDASLLETLASEHEIKSLYEQVGSPPDPSVYWTGSVGDMGFGAAPWSSSERLEEGGNTNSPTPSELESYADFVSGVTPSVKWSEYWGQTDAPVPADGGPAKSTVVFFAKSINEDGETTSTGTVTVTFTIEPGQRVSTDTPVIESSSGSMGSWIVAQSDGTVRVEPPVERGKRNAVSALAVEIVVPKDGSTSSGYVPNDLVATDKLKVAKWENAFEGSSQSPSLKQNFNEGDIDRFYLKVPMPWKEGQGTATVKIKTDSDPENEIEVTEIPGQPGVFRTKGLILVADDVDDAYPPNTDEQLDDVTYKVKLGDKVTFRIPTPSGGFSEVSADVPTRGVLSLAVWHVPTTWNGIAVRSKPEVDKAVERIKEAYAQAGIKVDASIKTENWTESVRQLQAGTPREGTEGFIPVHSNGILTKEYKEFIDSFPDGGSTTVDLFFVGATAGSEGAAVLPGILLDQSGETPYRYADNAFVHDYNLPNEFGRMSSTPQHEVLHIMRGVAGHHPSKFNILVDGGGTTTTVTGSRRISQSQEDEMFEHAAVRRVHQ